MLTLSNFNIYRPEYAIAQGQALAWLSDLHAASEATQHGLSDEERARFAARFSAFLERCACGADKIGSRAHVTADVGFRQTAPAGLGAPELGAPDELGAPQELSGQGPNAPSAAEAIGNPPALYDVSRFAQGQGTAQRSRLFARVVNAYFEREYADVDQAPSELIHVTCTGYVAPSGAQRVVAHKGWGALTHVTHAYHMGCYAALPAIRMAAGHFGISPALQPVNPQARVDIVHTELCSLHLDPSDHSAEQCVVQSLFADGFIRYSLSNESSAADGLEVLALSEQIVPDSAQEMGWVVGDFGMQMTLTRSVPERIAQALRPFVMQLSEKAHLKLDQELKHCVVAVHPGGPKIIERTRQVLELQQAQVQASCDVLFDYGNMSSATLPHVWQRICADASVRAGTLVLSLAFGPGLSVCGALFRKR